MVRMDTAVCVGYSCPWGTVFGADVYARGIFGEARCGGPFGIARRGGNRGALWFHVSIRKASGVSLEAQVEANVHL